MIRKWPKKAARRSSHSFCCFNSTMGKRWTVVDDDEQIRYFRIQIFILLTTHNNNNHIIKMRMRTAISAFLYTAQFRCGHVLFLLWASASCCCCSCELSGGAASPRAFNFSYALIILLLLLLL